MSYVASELRRVLRAAAADFLVEQAEIVADEIVADGEDFGEDYIPEVEMGGARDFGDQPIISPEQEAEQEAYLGILAGFVEKLQARSRELEAEEAAARAEAGVAENLAAGGTALQRCTCRNGLFYYCIDPAACRRGNGPVGG